MDQPVYSYEPNKILQTRVILTTAHQLAWLGQAPARGARTVGRGIDCRGQYLRHSSPATSIQRSKTRLGLSKWASAECRRSKAPSTEGARIQDSSLSSRTPLKNLRSGRSLDIDSRCLFRYDTAAVALAQERRGAVAVCPVTPSEVHIFSGKPSTENREKGSFGV